MYNKYTIWLSWLLAFMILSPPHFASADEDYIEARQLHDSGKILPLESILKRVRQIHPGKILEIELDREHGKIVYEVEILTKNGIVKEVYIDAETGEILFSKEDD